MLTALVRALTRRGQLQPRRVDVYSALQRAMTAFAQCGGPHTDPRISATAANTVAAKIAQSIKGFWGDADGVILPYVTLMLVVAVQNGPTSSGRGTSFAGPTTISVEGGP